MKDREIILDENSIDDLGYLIDKQSNLYLGLRIPIYRSTHPEIIFDRDSKNYTEIAIKNLSNIIWFYKSSIDNKSIDIAEKVLAYLYKYDIKKVEESFKIIFKEYNYSDYDEFIDRLSKSDIVDDDTFVKYFINVAEELCKQFLQCRLCSGKYFYSKAKSIYFRITKSNFDWSDIIWNFVYKNRKLVDDITIDIRDDIYSEYKILNYGGEEINHLSLEEFILLD